MMNLYIVSLQGNKYLLNIDSNNTILNVKNELSKKIDIIPERLKLIYCGQLLEDNKTTKEYQTLDLPCLHSRLRSCFLSLHNDILMYDHFSEQTLT